MRQTSIFGLTALAACALAGATAACSSSNNGSGRVQIDAQALCNQVINNCGTTTDGTIDQCVQSFTAVRVSQQCANDVKTATCADLASNTSNLTNDCFPPCTTPGSYACNLDETITECEPGAGDGGTARALTIDCADGCSASGQTFTGACGQTYEGQTADHQQCWCK